MAAKPGSKNRFLQDMGKVDWSEKIFSIGQSFIDLGSEIYIGIREKTMPVTELSSLGLVFLTLHFFHLDFYLFKIAHVPKLYPTSFTAHLAYVIFLGYIGFLFWGLIQLGKRRILLRRLSETLISSDLKNALGKLPSFIFDRPLDKFCRKLRLTRANLTFEKFKEAKSKLESSMQVFIEDMREDRAAGTIDIVYAHLPMPTLTKFDGLENVARSKFIVGSTRSEKIEISLKAVPHFLIAGQTGGGKSTFLRQMITTLYLRNKKYKFTLIDLKAGLEFGLFKDLPRIKISANMNEAVAALTDLGTELNERMAVLEFNGCKDIEAFKKIEKDKRKMPNGISLTKELDRHVLVIDECAELFLTGPGFAAKDTQQAKEVVSRLTRLGRACGVHVVLGTQRPDARAVDTQIKANLPGKLCFQMTDHHSSMVILGNSRARDLPEVAGRGIWQAGLKMTEVQTPFLNFDQAERLLHPFRSMKASPQLQTNNTSVASREDARTG